MKNLLNPRRTYSPFNGMTESAQRRGKPNSGDVIHLCIPATRDGCHAAKPACGNGAYHLWWNDNKTRVTCPACLAIINR
jgi:hypothetical protein